MNNDESEESPEKNIDEIDKNTLSKNQDSINLNSSLQNLITILNLMSIEFPLSDFAEIIESETGGTFTFKQLYQIIHNNYKKLTKKDKKNLIKYLPLTPLDISLEKPYISIFSIFNYFSMLLNTKIISPSLIIYEIANKIKNFYRKSTIEFFSENDYEVSGEIKQDELINFFYKKLKIGEKEIMIFYDMVNYNKKNKVKIEDIILTIDSFRDDNNNDIFNEKDKNLLFLKIILDKVFINIDKIFKKENKEYLNYSDLKDKIMKEISKNKKYLNYEEYINENLLDNIFSDILIDDKLYYKDYKKSLNESISKLKNNKIKLTTTQKYWINKYIDKLLSKSIDPLVLFKETNSINLKNIQKLLLEMSLTINDINNIINSLDINHIGTLDYSEYEIIINIVNKEKESIKNLEYPNNILIEQKEENNDKIEINNMWDCGIRPSYYYLLPIKGNDKILSKLNKNIQGKNFEKNHQKLSNINSASKSSIFSNKKSALSGKDKLYKNEYNDEYFLKILLENFNFNKNKFPCYNLLNYLLQNGFSCEYCSQIIKIIDKDSDGYIDILDLIKFLLHTLKYKSTKLVFKYLYIRIYNELKLKSCQEFFKMYNFELNSVIDNEKLIKFMKDINIDFPLTKEILYEINIMYEQPLIYKYISEQIDFYKKDKFINNLQYSPNEKEYIDYNTKNFEQEISSNIKKGNLLKTEFNSIIKKCSNQMNYSEYLSSFANPLGLDDFFALIIFQLLKTFSDKGEQIISKNDLKMFFDSYSLEKNIKKTKNKDIKEIIEYIITSAAPIKYAFEILPFRKTGLIPSSELIKYLCQFYGDTIQKSDLINIVFFIDKKKRGIIGYGEIQKFINKYTKKFSYLIELQVIVCNICKFNFNNAESYFNQEKFKNIMTNRTSIGLKQHNILLNGLCSNDSNKENLFIYLSKNKDFYDLQTLIDLLNYYLELDSDLNYNKINVENEVIGDNTLPNKQMVEFVLKKINIGMNGNISLNEFVMKFKVGYRKKLISKLDKNKKGFISFPELIKQLSNIYGTDIDLNYKLCAQYLFTKYIKYPDDIREYILKKANASFIETFISHKSAYKNFLFAFCNNKLLFEAFYMNYKEKKGKHAGMLNLANLEQFIIINNRLVSPSETEISNNKNIDIKEILSKKHIKIKDLINHINVGQSNLNKNFMIKENYIRNILETKLGFIDKDIDLICKSFNAEEGKFNLKKLFLYENDDIKKYDNILNDEIIPKIRNKIKRSQINSYKEYKLKIFNNVDYLDICELFSKFNTLYNISLYNCLLLMKNEQFFSTEKFFTETNLKDEFKVKDIEPALKLALIRLNDFFKKNKDKIKVFKEFDLNRNGKLSSDEFITALNSFENLNLNDSQKYKILNLVDTNNDGIIDINEFIKFVNDLKNNINEEGEINLNSILFKKKLNLNINKIMKSEGSQSNLITDRSQIQNNINYNKNILKQNNDIFLNYIIILQEDLLYKNDNDNIEKEFKNEDPVNKGIISVKKFKNILKKKLLNIKNDIINKFIELANKGIKNEDNKENKTEKINYQNFLINLASFKFNQNDNVKQSTNEDIILPKIN